MELLEMRVCIFVAISRPDTVDPCLFRVTERQASSSSSAFQRRPVGGL
jgi:hypothetical protein